MRYRRYNSKLLLLCEAALPPSAVLRRTDRYVARVFHLAAAILFFIGCAEQIKKPLRVCPGKETVPDALSTLRLHFQNAVPLKANGQCLLEYLAEGKRRKENFPVQIWLNPPAGIYMQGDVAFNPRGIILGSNENEFWLAIRLKEIDSCWLGSWEQSNYVDGLIIDPRIVLEALGVIAVDVDETGAQNWSLSKEGAFDVLTGSDYKTGIIKKIYIDNCDYSVRKIQYFYMSGKCELTAELDRYKYVTEKFFVPGRIKIVRYGENPKDVTIIAVNLSSVKSVLLSAKQHEFLFNQPNEKGFKHVFVNVDGRWIEQRQD